MRPLIEVLDVDALEWQPLGPPGLYSKLLSRDPQSGARTALQRMVPEDGYTPPREAHYHHTYEELLGVKGLFSFDTRRWVRPLSYLYHPPLCVHGFKSTVPQESWFLSRVGCDLDFNFVPEPLHDDIYPVDGVQPVRGIAAIVDPVAERGMTLTQWGKGQTPVEWCALSEHPHTGEGSALVRIPGGWRSELAEAVHREYLEFFVIDGALELDGIRMSRHFYTFRPQGTFPRVAASQSGALIYLNFGPRLQ